jgi:hypothetical protein
MGETSVHFRETAYHRFVEYTMVGYTSGYLMANNWRSLRTNVWTGGILQGDYLVIIPIIVGLLLYTRFFRQYRVLNRWPIAIMMGSALAISTRKEVTNLWSAITGTMKLGTASLTDPSNIIFVLATLTVLSYFIFTREQKGLLGISTRTGRAFIMLAFGVSYSALVIGKGTAFVEMMRVLLWRWLQIH